MSSNFLSLNPSKPEFFIFVLPQQLSELNNPTIHLPNNVILSPVDSPRNLGVIFKSCFHNIRDLRCICNTIYQTTACTMIATSQLTIVTLFNSAQVCPCVYVLSMPGNIDQIINCLQGKVNTCSRGYASTFSFHASSFLSTVAKSYLMNVNGLQ